MSEPQKTVPISSQNSNPNEKWFGKGGSNFDKNKTEAFILKMEGPLLKWLENKQNMTFFTRNPIEAIFTFCVDEDIKIPDYSFELLNQATVSHHYNTRRLRSLIFKALLRAFYNQSKKNNGLKTIFQS